MNVTTTGSRFQHITQVLNTDLQKQDSQQVSYKPAAPNDVRPEKDLSGVRDITLEEYVKRKETWGQQHEKLMKAAVKESMSTPLYNPLKDGISPPKSNETTLALHAFMEKTKELAKFERTEEYSDYKKKLMLEHGKRHDIETIITIGEDKITIDYRKWLTIPNKFQLLKGVNANNILSILHASYGKENVEVETFKKGEGPTNAEFFEETTGKSYYRYVMSDGRF